MADKDFPAFPRQWDKDGHNGMTLRDYFASSAMQGELAAQHPDTGYYENVEALAVMSYRIAEAMLKERDR